MRTVDTAIYKLELRKKQSLDDCEYLFDSQTHQDAVNVFQRVLASFPNTLTETHITQCFEQLEESEGGLRSLKIHLQDGQLVRKDDPKGIYGYGRIRVVRLAETSSYTDRVGDAVFRALPDQHLREQKHVFFLGVSKNFPVAFIFCERIGLYYLANYIEKAFRAEMSTVYSDYVVKIEPHISSSEIDAAKQHGHLRKITLTTKNVSSDVASIESVKGRPFNIKQDVTISIPKQKISKSSQATVNSPTKETHYSDIQDFIVMKDPQDLDKGFTFSDLGDFDEARFTVEYGDRQRTFRLGTQKRFLPVYEVRDVKEITSDEDQGELDLNDWYLKAKEYFAQILHDQGMVRNAST